VEKRLKKGEPGTYSGYEKQNSRRLKSRLKRIESKEKMYEKLGKKSGYKFRTKNNIKYTFPSLKQANENMTGITGWSTATPKVIKHYRDLYKKKKKARQRQLIRLFGKGHKKNIRVSYKMVDLQPGNE
jgi:hypothetical protein